MDEEIRGAPVLTPGGGCRISSGYGLGWGGHKESCGWMQVYPGGSLDVGYLASGGDGARLEDQMWDSVEG